jgi:hypothetical protein
LATPPTGAASLPNLSKKLATAIVTLIETSSATAIAIVIVIAIAIAIAFAFAFAFAFETAILPTYTTKKKPSSKSEKGVRALTLLRLLNQPTCERAITASRRRAAHTHTTHGRDLKHAFIILDQRRLSIFRTAYEPTSEYLVKNRRSAIGAGYDMFCTIIFMCFV